MSALGHKQTFRSAIVSATRDVRFGPKAEVETFYSSVGFTRESRPCIRRAINDRLLHRPTRDRRREAFADYLKQTMPFIEKHGGRYLTKAGTHEMLEGQRPSRVVVVEFPSKQAIKDWYNDPGYRPLVAKRHAAARSVMIAVECQ